MGIRVEPALEMSVSLKPFSRRQVTDIRIDRFDDTIPTLTSRNQFAGEISKLWADVQHRFVQIGRYLTQAKQALPHGEYLEMIERDLPFSRFVAHQLRAVAEAIDTGVVPVERLPNNYSTIYQVVTLSPEERTQALETNIIRPEMRRADLVEFKRRLRTDQSERHVVLEREKKRIIGEIQRLQARLREIEDELGAPVIDLAPEGS
jgi:hypothetical protein